jgi:hypothetical protein
MIRERPAISSERGYQNVSGTSLKRDYVEAFTELYKVHPEDPESDLDYPVGTVPLDWIKDKSSGFLSSAFVLALAGAQVAASGLYSAVKQICSALEERSPKRRKISPPSENSLMAIPESLTDPTPLFEDGHLRPQDSFLKRPAYERPLPSSIRKESMVQISSPSLNQIDRPPPIAQNPDRTVNGGARLLRSALFKASSAQFDKSALDQKNIHLPVLAWKSTTKSSGGLFTPRAADKWESSLTGSPMDVDNSPIATPMFRRVIPVSEPTQPPLTTTPSFVPATNVIPNVTYGTAFILNRNPPEPPTESQQNLRQSTLASRLRDAFKGTYTPPKTIVPPKSVSVTPQQVWPKTPLLVSYKEPGFLQKLQLKRDRQLEKKKIAQKSVELPQENALSPDKLKRYEEINRKRKSLQEQIEQLRLGDDKEVREQPLDQDSLQLVEKYWNTRGRHNDGQIIGTAFKVDVQVGDIKTLSDGAWLNDNVIDFYLSLVTEKANSEGKCKSFAFSTHFYSKLDSPAGYKSVARWAKRKGIDVTTVDYVFVPINRNGNHWCLVVINNKQQKLQYYDSMNGNGERALVVLRDYMIAEADRIYANKHDEHEARYNRYQMLPRCRCPQQANGYDCGVFTCKNVELLSQDRPLNYLQQDMRLVRRRMAYDILQTVLRSKL